MEKKQEYPYRFSVQDVKLWKDYLDQHGYVVVGDVLSQDLCNELVQEIQECFTKISFKLKMDDEETWKDRKNYPILLNGGMVQYVGHSKFQWTCRERAAPIFAEVWDVKPTELATSFDGFCYMDARREFGPLQESNHTDQSPKKDFRWSVQGLFNLIDNGPDDGGFIVVPDTHKVHKKYLNEIGKGEVHDDWYHFAPEEKKDPMFDKTFKVCAKAGDFIMWDSRTFHGNTTPTGKISRAAVYVCQIPKANIPKEAIQIRIDCWKDRSASTHHPGDFREIPRTLNKRTLAEVSVKDEDLSDLQKSLIYIK